MKVKLNLLKRKLNLINALPEERDMNEYERLFTNMGIMNPDKGQWIRLIDKEERPNYRLTRFELSDNLSCTDFIKRADDIKEKIRMEYLEIVTTDGEMHFKIRKDELSLVRFKYIATPKNVIPLGIDLDNALIQTDIRKDPHMLIAGMSNSGKSTLLNMIILHIVMNNMGDMHLIDLKDGVELFPYKDLKQVKTFAYDIQQAKDVIKYYKEEAQKRFTMLRENGYRNYEAYMEKNPQSTLKREYLIIDEIADLMLLNTPKTKKEKATEFDAIQELITLGRKCRAVGLHIICATQKPTADSLPTQLRAQLGCIIGFRQNSQINSRIVIDENGLELLENRFCIGIVGGERVSFRTMYLDEDYMNRTIAANKRSNSVSELRKPDIDKLIHEIG